MPRKRNAKAPPAPNREALIIAPQKFTAPPGRDRIPTLSTRASTLSHPANAFLDLTNAQQHGNLRKRIARYLKKSAPNKLRRYSIRNSISLLSAIQATGFLTITLVGLSPTEHTSFSWTRFRTVGFPSVRLQGRCIRRAFLATASSSRRAVCIRPSCTSLPVTS